MSLHQLIIQITLVSFRQISDAEPGYLHAFDWSRELVDSDDDNDMGPGVEMRDDGNFESERDGIENTWIELAEEGDQLSNSLFS
jgi:hypothetical protein